MCAEMRPRNHHPRGLERLRDPYHVREVRDRLVYQEREAAGRRFQAARVEADVAKRKAELSAVQSQLQQLQERFPDSRYKDSVGTSIEAVKAAFEEETP